MTVSPKPATVTLESLVQACTECTPGEARQFVSTYAQLDAMRRSCPRHEFQPHSKERQICIHCKWVPTNLQLAAYRQGLEHGRASKA